jgi:hypothetical protein
MITDLYLILERRERIARTTFKRPILALTA